jgi:hypothetical protein
MKIKDMLLYGAFDAEAVCLQVLKTTKINLPQLLLFHQAD